MKLFLGYIAVISPGIAIVAQKQQLRLNQESSQLLRGASEAKILKAAAPVYDSTVAWNDLTGEISDSPESVKLETPHGEGDDHEGTFIKDVYVRWDQDECNPCEVPTLAPTLPPLYGDGSYEDHPPVVTDEYDSWDSVKEGHAPTYAQSEDQDEEEDEIIYEGGIRCTKITTAEGGVYQCESPEGNVYCTKVATEYGESYDCHPGTVQPAGTLICPDGQQRIGVSGWDHDGCVVSGNVCVSNHFGDCPRGAHCGRLGTGVYGCKDGHGCAANEQAIGVVGWDHDGCIVSDNICVAQVKNGDCPAGSYCSLLDSGVYGCVASSTPAPTSPYDASPMVVCPNGEQRIGVSGWDHDGCVVSGNVCVSNHFGDCPRGAHCGRLGMGVYGCKDGHGCAANEQAIGVVGWDHDGCIVSDNICVAQVKNGDCPAGSYCSLLDSGVYGCVAGLKDSGGSTKNGGATGATSATAGGTATSGTTTGGPTTGETSTGTTTGITTGTTYTGGATSGGATTGTPAEDTSNTSATSTPSTGVYGGDTANTAGATTTDSNTASANSPSGSEGLNAGAVIGIVIGCAVFVAIVVGAVLSWQKSVARQREENLFADLGGATDYAAM
ncbi:hypothetical protein DVH05_007737 [Phytophthora capsici]|nr:hypothetical protein DVH05_007737 [Phytophthora capsici]